jgi:hypothetical protein
MTEVLAGAAARRWSIASLTRGACGRQRRRQGARDVDLLAVVHDCERETATHLMSLKTRRKAAAPQVLVVADA